MSQELEANFKLTPHQRDGIRKILNRVPGGMSFIEAQDRGKTGLHHIAARNGIICLLSSAGWHFEDIAQLINQTPDYCAMVLKKFYENADQRKKDKSND